jgi:steroid delta-isomerase-like uncharacterized protein
MSIAESKAVADRVYNEAINGGDIDIFDELVSEDAVEHEAPPGFPTRGPDAPKAAFRMFFEAFPDLRMTVEDTIAENDKVVARVTMSGTHRGEFMGIPATNKSFEIQVIDILEVHDGKVTAHWGITDQAAMMEQLGVALEG